MRVTEIRDGDDAQNKSEGHEARGRGCGTFRPMISQAGQKIKIATSDPQRCTMPCTQRAPLPKPGAFQSPAARRKGGIITTSCAKAERARMFAITQQRNSLILWVARLRPCPSWAGSVKRKA